MFNSAATLNPIYAMFDAVGDLLVGGDWVETMLNGIDQYHRDARASAVSGAEAKTTGKTDADYGSYYYRCEKANVKFLTNPNRSRKSDWPSDYAGGAYDVRHPRLVPSLDAAMAMYEAHNITLGAWKSSVEPQCEVQTVRLNVYGTEAHNFGRCSY